MNGYNGSVLHIDLERKSWGKSVIPENILRNYIGGTGLAAWLLYAYCPAGIAPYDPRNPLIFCTSPLVGTQLTTSSKFAIATKSPLTGFIGDSMSSSFLATELKATGYDAVLIKGMAESWTSLDITEEGVQFLDANPSMGLTTFETERYMKNKLSKDHRIACIGPAGENLVRYATISNDGGRQAGRTGTGAVMGSKNLKAIAFRGRKSVKTYNKDALQKLRKSLSKKSLGQATEKYRTLGTMANTSVFNRLGTLPSFNFRKGSVGNIEEFAAESIHKETKVEKAHCANCTIGCEKLVEIPGGGGKRTRVEYQSAYALGPLNGMSDRASMLENSNFCDEMGMDTVSAGATISWYLECVERGLVENFIKFPHRKKNIVGELLRLVVKRQGVGDQLAEGAARASRNLGKGSEDFAMHVKGLEMPGYEPRSLKSMALALAVSTRGACHNRSSAYENDFSESGDRFNATREKGVLVAGGEDYSAVMDSLIWCKFVRKVFVDFYQESAEILSNITGWDMTAEELELCGERINNLKKLFNIREGWDRKDDVLPPRILTERLDSGAQLSKEDLDFMISSYYEARGWDEDGKIPDTKLHELDMTEYTELFETH